MVRLFICAVLLVSCTDVESKNINSGDNSVQIDQENETLKFTDIIPENITDSSKAEIIGRLIQDIRLDTTLVRSEFKDSTGILLNAYYRNDTLVQIVKGMHPGPEFDAIPFWGFNYTVCYFFMDSLIALFDNCSSIQQTGMCNPVSRHSSFYFYGDKIVFETQDSEIGNYVHCGCYDYSHKLALKDKRYFVEMASSIRLKVQ